jgi:hypothetical protein
MVPGCRQVRALKRTVRIYWPARATLAINRDAWTATSDLMSIASMLLDLSLQVAIYGHDVSGVGGDGVRPRCLGVISDCVPGMT